MKRSVLLISVPFFCSLALSSCSLSTLKGDKYAHLRTESVYHKAKNWMDLRFEKVTRQRYIFSCGFACLAMTLNDLGENITEDHLLRLVEKNMETDKFKSIVHNGIELRELATLLEIINDENALRIYGSKQYRNLSLVNLRELHEKIGSPIILSLNINGYNHYAVYCGEQNKKVHLKDPIRGHIFMTQWRFLDEWKGGALAVAIMPNS